MTDETQGISTPAPLTLIYLDVDDEITSAAARIRAAAAERVALVLPYGSRLATSRINFRLLAREATERGKHLEVICADASARSLAQAAGLPVHPSVAAFEGRAPAMPGASDGTTAAGATGGTGPSEGGATTHAATGAAGIGAAAIGPAADDDTQTRRLVVPRKRTPPVPIVGPPRPPVRPRLAIGVVAGLLAFLVVGAVLAVDLLPTATITLHPRSEEIGPMELSIEARTDVVAPDSAGLAIPAQLLTFELEAGETFPATGVKTVETKATGNVTFKNFDTSASNTIPAGSIVSTKDGIEFRTLTEVTIPASPIFPFPPAERSVGIVAVEPGPDGNVAANTVTVVPRTENKRLLDVTNEDATSGGDKTESPVVSDTDVEAAKAAIAAALVTDLDQQVAAGTGVPETVTLFPESRTVLEPQYAVDPATLIGTEGAQFDLAATAQGTAIGVDESPIAGIAESHLRAAVRTGWTLLPETINADIGTAAILGTIISYPVSISGTQVHNVDEAGIRAAIAGLVIVEARSKLDEYGDYDITVWPDWVTTVPKHDDRIIFQLAAPQPSASPTP